MVKHIMADHRQFKFAPAAEFRWSPRSGTIYFPHDLAGSKTGLWSLLHELGHAILDHHEFNSDIELIKIERSAWDKAVDIAKNYGLSIDEQHIEDCLDSYRHWLSRRSRCPVCDHTGLQAKPTLYNCVNCAASWQVPTSQSCRVSKQTV